MKTKYSIVFTGTNDPMWPFLLEATREEEKSKLLLFQTDDPKKCQITYDPINSKTEFSINGERIFGEDINSIWLRRFVPPELKHLDRSICEYSQREYMEFLEELEVSLSHCEWISLPSAINKARNKALQLRIANNLGFITPGTVFTNNPATLRAKILELPTIYKSIRSPRIVMDDGKTRTVFTTLLNTNNLADINGIATCPGILQDFIDKKADVRVSVFGDNVFPVLIKSQTQQESKTDFRCNAKNLEHITHTLPESINEKCRLLVKKLGLKFGAIDLALMPDDSYIFFEINPNGQWGWLEQKTGMPMRRTLLNMLFKD